MHLIYFFFLFNVNFKFFTNFLWVNCVNHIHANMKVKQFIPFSQKFKKKIGIHFGNSEHFKKYRTIWENSNNNNNNNNNNKSYVII